MNVVVKIKGRDALPVWVLPLVTGWALSPDMLIYRLVKPYHDGRAIFPTAFNLDTNNTPSSIPSAQWYEINNLIEKLRNEAKGQPKTEWRKRSIEIIKPLEAYVWLDEFNNWFEWSPEIFTRHGKDEITDEPITEPIELCFNPIMNTEDARYFEAEYCSLPVSNATVNAVTKWNESICETTGYLGSTEPDAGADSQDKNNPVNDKNDISKSAVPIEEQAPWWKRNPKDPQPKHDWYIPARYFARQCVKDDSTLLTNRQRLATKVVNSLNKVNIKKRGGKLPFNPATVLKAFSNITFE